MTEPQAAAAAAGKAAESSSALVGAPSRGFGSDFGSGHAFGRSPNAPCFCSGSDFGSCPFDSCPCPCPCRDPYSCSCCGSGCCCCFCSAVCDPCCGCGSGSGCPSGSFAIRGLGPCCRLCPDDRCRAAVASCQLRGSARPCVRTLLHSRRKKRQKKREQVPWLCWPAPAGPEPGA